jgi:SAM-dependent methyltransferase
MPESVPARLLVDTANKLQGGNALDLACGMGRNAIWLAQQGWNVTAVDRSAQAIEAIRKQGRTVAAHVADLEKHEFPVGESAWDLIVMCYYLQLDLFEPVKRGLTPGGIALAIVHLIEPGHERSRFSLQPGELAKYFEDWEVLHYREGQASDPEHQRAVAEIVARRPGRLPGD